MEIINVQYLEKAPSGFHGFVTENEDCSYTIFLDPNDSAERQKEALIHEVRHILNGDLRMDDAGDIEREAHEKEKR